MYYTFKCTYCGRLFYTYDNNREHASHILYQAVKQHLVDYDEDKKEHEIDDGEEADSNQIYSQMQELTYRPPDGYEAFPTSSTKTYSESASANNTIFFIIVIIGVVICILFFLPQIITEVKQLLPK